MKLLYGIEPDLCIINPEILVNFTKDIILPKYFYSQITHLSQGNFQVATDAATVILNSLIKQEQSDVLIFQTVNGGIVYFTDEATHKLNIDNCYENLDIKNLLDRYLLSLLKLSEILEAKTVFVASSAEVIRKCRSLNFEVATLEEFLTPDESWLQPEILIDIQASMAETTSEAEPVVTQQHLNTTELEPFVQIEWRDIRVPGQLNNLKWIDITLR